MRDNYNRDIDYVRISLTEKCNLKCIYCMPEGYVPRGEEEITREDVNKILVTLASMGIKKVRFTGGEPLVRNDIVDIIKDTKKIPGIKDIAITTNAVLLDKKIYDLKEAGLTRINISLDSLKPETFKNITGGNVEGILNGIKKAVELGIFVKLNMLPIKGYNDNEIEDFINLTKDMPIDVRFIELMPMGPAKDFRGIKSDDIKDIIVKMGKDYTEIENEGTGPAILFKLEGHKGRVGFISPMSHKFCHLCNRIRITSDKKLKTCLHNLGEVDLGPFINDSDALKEVLNQGILKKYEKHTLDTDNISKSGREMVRIGG
ncbi:GTP 3',8-cyclase MoaA [Clostridium cylindrosporum]|uniref:GTP 3',8-cyclase n=1 Tax=Clostridium cylindrosporum DSM 605 TaxID=1121307 RepID=A0A0J8DEU1_CLOCY|nr:GTP 3',8-cyclase MoaA [Clostridium cylindrosporum]KMT22698.1 cyclic pyranopterin monophosphate synthase subunit MoaA [Clostridium cylindrosporum DSM 605]